MIGSGDGKTGVISFSYVFCHNAQVHCSSWRYCSRNSGEVARRFRSGMRYNIIAVSFMEDSICCRPATQHVPGAQPCRLVSLSTVIIVALFLPPSVIIIVTPFMKYRFEGLNPRL